MHYFKPPLLGVVIDLEPIRLAKYLIEQNPDAPKTFSQIERTLYYRVLDECCNHIVDTASNFPSFSERTLSIILQRENELLEITNRLLEETAEIKKASERWNTYANEARFETEYHRTIVRKLDTMELFGVDVVSRASRKHSLSVAYVSLSVGRQWEDISERRVSLSADKAIARSRFLLIRGLAGSGKTTLLKWIAVQAASRQFKGELSEWNKLVPFFIRLRLFTNKPLPSPKEFPALIAPEITALMPEQWAFEQLISGRGIVLIDGIDEIPITQRKEVRNWITGLVDVFSLSRFIITSRPSAIDEWWLSTQQFDDAHLQPMTMEQILTFVEQWHEAVAQELQDSEEKISLKPLADGLKKILLTDESSITNLAQTPLLCAMLCALFRERHQQLPSERAELYEDCCRMLLDLRDRERGIILGEYPDMSYALKKQVMQGFSYWMLQNNWAEANTKNVDNYFETQLARMGSKLKVKTGSDLRQYFIDRSGMLRLSSSTQITFTHRTFQEYLSAQEALDIDHIGVLIQKADDDQWREVILLAAGLANPRQGEMLIEGILNRESKILKVLSEDRRLVLRKLYIIAALCANVAITIEPDLKKKVQDSLKSLLPPQNREEALQLTETAPIITPLLRFNDKHNEKDSIVCIQMLGKIGGLEAFKTLRSYVTDRRKKIIWQLLKMWSSFDEVKYVKYILEPINIAKQKHLQVSSGLHLAKISNYFHLANLRSLNVVNCDSDMELKLICSNLELRSLGINRCRNLSTLYPLFNLTHLRSLYLANPDLSMDLNTLDLLDNLNRLILHGWADHTDLSPLENLPQLEHLELRDSGTRNLIYALEKMTKLKTLTLSGTSTYIAELAKNNTKAKVIIQ